MNRAPASRPARRRSLRDFVRAERGSLTVEYVIILPMFLVALAFAFEFGQIFIAHQSVENNVRSAVRYLARSDLDPGDLQTARNIAMTGRPTGGTAAPYLTCAVPPPGGDDPTAADSCIGIDPTAFFSNVYGRSGKTVRINMRMDYSITFFGFLGPDVFDIEMYVSEDARHSGV